MADRSTRAATPPPAIVRRLLARCVDWLGAGLITAVVCWPIAWQALRGEFTGTVEDLATMTLRGALSVGDIAQGVVHSVQRIIAVTLLSQVVLMAVYEWLATSATGTTVGKALTGIRVVPASAEPVRARADWGLRMMRRAAAAVLPLGIASVGFLFGIAGSALGWIGFAASAGFWAFDVVPVVTSGRCRHDDWADSLSVPADWAVSRRRGRAVDRGQSRQAGSDPWLDDPSPEHRGTTSWSDEWESARTNDSDWVSGPDETRWPD